MFISKRDLASKLSVSTKTIQRLLGEGAFPNAIRLGHRDKDAWRIPQKDVDEFISSRRVVKTAA